jgi:hypothetical protein
MCLCSNWAAAQCSLLAEGRNIYLLIRNTACSSVLAADLGAACMDLAGCLQMPGYSAIVDLLHDWVFVSPSHLCCWHAVLVCP